MQARLLYYYPSEQAGVDVAADTKSADGDFSSWWGWHNDHGALTGLAQGMYFDEDGHEVRGPQHLLNA